MASRKEMVITSCGNSVKMAKEIARKLKIKYVGLEISAFPDGDMYMRFQKDVKHKKVIIVQSFQPDADKSLFKVIFAAETARDLGAKKVILVAPYLAYMRQDIRFNPGEAISSRIMAKHLNMCLDKIITIDPHLHRYKSLKDIFTIATKKITANHVIVEFLKKMKNLVIIGPDWESYQWAEDIARHVGVKATVLHKTRYSSHKVKVKMIKPVPIKGKNVVIIDDIISTGHTMMEAAKKARVMGAKSVTAVGVHGLFVDGMRKLRRSGISRIVTTNCIRHSTNKIDVTNLLVEELRKE
jgi:ribose-phosphate pyrophosphokinase